MKATHFAEVMFFLMKSKRLKLRLKQCYKKIIKKYLHYKRESSLFYRKRDRCVAKCEVVQATTVDAT